MPEDTPPQLQDAVTLHRLMPNLSDQQRVEQSVIRAESNGDQNVRANSERRIQAHLARLTTLLQREAVEPRVWNSAVGELVIQPDDIPDSYWNQQEQIARDNGQGNVHLSFNVRQELTEQIQDAQRTGLNSWRNYLETTGNQYPVWFKFYAWDGMSRLGVFNQEKGCYNKRSRSTVAPYPQLNPAALGKVFEAVKDQGGEEDEAVANLVRSGNFNKLYSHMLLDQKALIPTPEKSEDVRGVWKEYSGDDIQALIEAAEGTPWCIAGRSMAESYTTNGKKFLLFHLQDPETGKVSPTAAASVRLDEHGQVVELSGLKGGANQYVEDALIPVVQEKVRQLPGGERFLQAFEDKQMLIQMDRKFQNGEPFSQSEILFLYEVERPIKFLDTYAQDPRVDQFRRNRKEHIAQMAEVYGGEINAQLVLDPIRPDDRYAENRIHHFFDQGGESNFLLEHLDPETTIKHIEVLLKYGVNVNGDEIAEALPIIKKLEYFDQLKKAGATITGDELADMFPSDDKLDYFEQLKSAGATLTADDVAADFDDNGKFTNLIALKKIGAEFDVDELIVRNYGESEIIGLKDGVSTRGMGSWLKGGASPELMLKMLKMAKSQDTQLHGEGGVYSTAAVDALRTIMRAVPSSDTDQEHFIDLFYNKLRDNPDTFVGAYGSGDHKFINDFLDYGFDVNIVARKLGVYGGSLAKFMKFGVDQQALLDGLTLGHDGRIFSGNEDDSGRTYYLSQNITQLVEYGCDIKDIVKHMAKKYQLEHFDELQQYSASLDIEAIVAGMRPYDVLTNLSEVTKHGVKLDINKLLDSLDGGQIYESNIDELLALGADPEKIAVNLPSWMVGYDSTFDRWKRVTERTRAFRDKYPEIYEVALGHTRANTNRRRQYANA